MADVSFGEYFKQLRKQKGFTFAEFRRQIALSKTYLVDIENGDTFPAPDTQIKMTEILGLNDTEREEFFDRAAAGRNEIPIDIVKHLKGNPEAIKNVRKSTKA